MGHEYRRGPHLVIEESPTASLAALEPPVPPWRKAVRLPPPGPPLTPEAIRAGSIAAWESWAAEHRYPDGVRAAVALAICDGALWRAGKFGGHRVRVEGLDSGDVRMKLAGFVWDAGEWVWRP